MEQKRAWIYCRVAHNGPDSARLLEEQRHRLKAYAKEHHLEVTGFSSDIGSGTTFDNRPGLLEFHTAAVAGEVDILLLCDLTRLSRDLDKGIQYWYLLRDLDVGIHTANNGEVDLSIAATIRKILEQ